MIAPCNNCGEKENISRERRPDGHTKCCRCGHWATHQVWDAQARESADVRARANQFVAVAYDDGGGKAFTFHDIVGMLVQFTKQESNR